MKKSILKNIISRLIILLVLTLFIPVFCFSQLEKQKTVVFLSSFHDNNRWTKSCRQALEDKFAEEGYSIKLNALYLDAKNIVNPEVRKNIVKLYFSSLQEKVDVIVAFDYEAADLVLTYTDSSINKIPIVFVSELEHGRRIENKNVTGIISDYGVEQTYITGLKMFPKTKKVYVWADKSTTGEFFINEAKLKLKPYEKRTKIEYGIDAKNKQEFLDKCKKIEPNSFVIFCTWQRDDNGKYHVAADFYPEFVKATPAPVFTALDNYMGCGFIGGYVQSPVNNGRAAAEMAIRIFKGEKPEDMPIEYVEPVSVFDVAAIREKGGIRKVIAYDSSLINSFDGFIRENFIWIIFASVLIMTILVLIFVQVKNRKLIKKIKKNIEEEKKMKLDLKLLSFSLPSLNTVSWFYDERKDHFVYGDNVEQGKLGYNSINSFKDVIGYVHPDDKEKFISFFTDFIKQDSGDFSFTYRGNYKGRGAYSWWECRGILETREDKKGRYKFFYGMDINIDKHKEQEQKLSDALEKAVQSDKLKSAFIANISHEIRTPLNSIVGFSELMMHSENYEEKEGYCQIVKENNDILLKLINDILELSKLESGFLEINNVTVDLKQYFEQMAGLFNHRLDEGVELICDNPHKSCIVELDKNLLSQVISNFITNAIKFTHKGFIKIGYEVVDKGIKIYCQDTGIGIKQEDIPKIFNRFEKLNSFEQGTGLGLAICKSIIDALGGECGVDSKEGEGSNFWAFIPCNVIIIDDENQKETNVEIEYLEYKKDKQTILIAEDIDSNYLLLEILLKNKYKIIRAVNGKEAVEMVKTENPDVVLMDIIMPVMDGFQATRKIREFNKDILIITLTVRTLDSDRKEAFSAGCNEFIPKPLDENVLFEILNKYCCKLTNDFMQDKSI